jgi:O-antigen/teichoic acid export membrane protein
VSRMRLRHVGFQGFGLLAKRGFLALSFLIVARAFGPARFGDFTYLTTWVLVINLVAALGLPSVTTREIACHPEQAAAILRSTLRLRVVLSLAGMLVLNVLFHWTPIGHVGIRGYAAMLSLALPALAISDQLAAYVIGFNSHHQFASINGCLWGAYLLATGIGLALHASLRLLFVVQVVALWTAAGYFGIVFRRDWRKVVTGQQPRTNYLLRQAAPIAITGVLGILSFRIGTFLLYKFLGPAQTGLYTSALQVVEGLQLIPMAITGAIFPSLCRVVGDRYRLSSFVEWLFLTLAFLGLGAGATASVVGPRLITLVFGVKYAAAGGLFTVLVWALVPMFLHFGLTFVLIASNRQKVFIFESVIYLAVSVSANLMLIPRYGIMGSAYAALLSESTLLAMHLFFVFSRIEIRRTLSWLTLPAAMACCVVLCGSAWRNGINAAAANALAFGAVSAALFGAGYWLYHHASPTGLVFSSEAY